MSAVSLPSLLEAGKSRGLEPDQIAAGVRKWQTEMVGKGRESLANTNPEQYWKGVSQIDEDVHAALTGLGAQAAGKEAARRFPDPAQRQQFLSVVESSGFNPDNMDAPPEWQDAARAVAAASSAPAFAPPAVQAGRIADGPNELAFYEMRSRPDGGYEAYVKPAGKDTKPVIVNVSGDREALKAQAGQALTEAQTRYQQALNSAGSDIGWMTDKYEEPKRLIGLNTARLDLYSNGPQSQILHTELDQALRKNDDFLKQLPQNRIEQFTTRPLTSVIRSLAQAADGLTGGQRAVGAEGQQAVDLVTPGNVRSRFAAGDEGAIGDQISQGIESGISLIGPSLVARGAGGIIAKLGSASMKGAMATEALAGADVASKAAWGTLYATAYGANYAGALQEADSLQASDPQRAATIRSLAQFSSLTKAGIELATERIFPDEARLLKGQRLPWKSIATLPLKESVEEYVGAQAGNALNTITGQAQEDPLKAAEGGFWGSLPFMGAAIGNNAFRAPAAPAAAAPEATAPIAIPAEEGGPNAALFPPNLGPAADTTAPPASAPTAPPAPSLVSTAGRTTAYGYRNDPTPDSNSSAGIGAFVPDDEAAKIKRGEPSDYRLRAGDLAVSPDIESQFRKQGISPGDQVTLAYADGTTHTGRWMDRTDGSLDGRFDLYSPNGPAANDGSRITGFAPAAPGSRAGLTPATAVDPQGTVPETPETLREQRRRVLSGQRPAMLFPGMTPEQVPAEFLPGQEEPLMLTHTPAGTFLHGFDFSSAEISQAVDEGRTGNLLGMATPAKPEGATGVVVHRAANGTEITAAAVTADSVEATAAGFHAAASPGDTVNLEHPGDVLASRMAAPTSEVEYGLFGDPIAPDPAPGTSSLAGLEIREVPVGEITLSKDVPQFKEDANKDGVVVPLGGKFERLGTGPILLWKRLNGQTEVISGRHRLDLARRSGETTIPAQIVNEAEGFDLQQAITADAELNIRDEKGTIKDFATYFRGSSVTQSQAEERGLLARAPGKSGWIIGRDASESLFELHANERLSDNAAVAIASAAPGNEGLQRIGAQSVLEGSPIDVSVNLMRAASAAMTEAGNAGTQLDLFGADDSAMVEMRNQAKNATAIQRRIKEQISAVQGAAKRPEVARKMGVQVDDPAAVQAQLDRLRGELDRWQNWPLHPDLMQQAREGVKADSAVAETELETPASRLAQAEQWADSTIRAARGQTLSGVPDPALLAAYAVKGLVLLNRGVREFSAWSAEMLKEFGEAIRPWLDQIFQQSTGQADTSLTDSTVPLTPQDGPPVNIFGQRVKADDRLRESWRATFAPAETSPFTEEELGRKVREWIGREGGLEGASKLFLDPESPLRDYERNALGQQLAIGLDLRARRAEAAGNTDAVHQAEALLDTTIAHLETFATKAGQALRAFGMWAKFSPRGIVRSVERTADVKRRDHAKTTLNVTPAQAVDAANTAAAEAAKEADKERKDRTPAAVTAWIQRLARSQSDTLAWANPKALSELELLIRAHMETIIPDFDARAQGLGVPAHESGVLDGLVLEEHRRSAGLAKELAILKLTQKLQQPAAAKATKAKIPPLAEILMAAHAAGGLTDKIFLNAYAKAFNLPVFTPEFAAKVRAMASQVEAAPAGSWLRSMAQRNLMGKLALWEGISVRDSLTAYWYANVLSGLGTQLVNISGNGAHLLLKTVQVALVNNPAHTVQFVRGMLKGAAQGTVQGVAAFVNGAPVMKGETEWQRQDVLEMMWNDDPKTVHGLILKYGAASWGRYVFRALTAMDSLFFNTAKEGRAWLETSRALAHGQSITAEMGFDAPTWAAAQSQASADLSAAGVARPTTREVDRRAFEIVEGRRRAEVTASARRFGAEATFNYEPEGTMGAFAEVANLLVKLLPPTRALVPFVNIVANVADQGLDFTPIGIVRAGLGRHVFNNKSGPFTRQQRMEKAAAGAIGLLSAAALYALAKSHEKEDDDKVSFMVYGGGPSDKNARNQMPRGWKPFSIKIGDTYYSYAETPLGLILSTVGTAMDLRRYGHRKDADEPMRRAMTILTGAGQSLMRTGVLSSLDKLFGSLDGSAKPQQVLFRSAAGFIPAQGLMRNIAEVLDPQRVDTSTFEGTILSNLPVLRGQGKPMLNVFGEPVREPGPWLISRLATKQDRSDVEATWLSSKGLRISALSDELAVSDFLPDTKAEAYKIAHAAGLQGLNADRAARAALLERTAAGYLTTAERTALLRTSGPAIRDAVKVLRRSLDTGSYKPTSPAALQSHLSAMITTVRQTARLKLVK